jgi:hypothetical protein
MLHRQQSRIVNSPNNCEQQQLWDSNEATNGAGNSSLTHVTTAQTYASIVKPPAQISGQCIPGSNTHVSVKPAVAPSKICRQFEFELVVNRKTFLLQL